MNAKAVLRFMKEQKFGFDRWNIKAEKEALSPDQVSSGRFQLLKFTDEDGKSLSDVVWVPPMRSEGTRLPTERTKGHSRGYIVDPGAHRAIGFESTHEMRCAMMLMASRDIVMVEDQPPAVKFIGADGETHRHTFDYRATYANGTRIAIAVKPSHLVKKSDIRNIVKRIRPVLGQFANSAVVLTEKQLTKERAWNAKSVLRARRCRNEKDCEEVHSLVMGINGGVTVYEIAKRFGDYASAMNAIWCLIYDKTLYQVDPSQRLFDAPYVRVARSAL